MKLAGPPRVGLYLRISDDHMGTGLGVARQEEDCRKLSALRGGTVTDVYCDNDKSAYQRRKPRPEYARMLADMKAGKLDMVVAWHPDRLHRQTRELAHFIDVVNDHGVQVETVTAGLFDLSTPNGRMQARIAGAVAEHESEHKSERIKRKLEQNAAQGKRHGGSRPFGWQADGVTLDPHEADVIRLAVKEILSGKSVIATARLLNERGYVTATGKRWQPVTLRGILIRPRIAGIRVHHGEEVGKGEWEPVLPVEDYRALQAVLLNPSRVTNPGKSGKVHLLSVISRCGVCDGPIVVGLGRAYKGKAKPIYRCKKAHVSRDQEAMDKFITRLIMARMKKADIRELMQEAASRKKASKSNAAKIAELELDMENMSRAHAAKKITLAQLIAYNEDVQPQIDRLRQENVSPDRERILGELVRADDPWAVWERWTQEQRRSAVHLLLEIKVLKLGRRSASFDPNGLEITWK